MNGTLDSLLPGSPAAPRRYPPDRTLELTHLDATLDVDIEGRRLRGEVRYTIRARGRADYLALDAVMFVSVDAAGEGLASAVYDDQALHLRWKAPFAPGEERTVTVSYEVHEPVSGLFFSAPGAPLFAATDNETERARYWLPTVDHPSVRPRLAIALRAPARLTALANGELIGEEDHGDGMKTTRWRLDSPCPSYLTCFCVGDLVEWDGGSAPAGPGQAPVPIKAFAVAPTTADDLSRMFDRSAELLTWLTKRLGRPYPYPKYYQFVVPGIGGAMENISLVSWDDRFTLDVARAPEIKHRVDSVNLHEMAHSWFGDHVVIRDFADAWLKEGWATYLESCWREGTLGADERDYDLYDGRRSYFEEVAGRYQRAIITRRFRSSWQLFDYHLYPGAAWRIHMLRQELGDDLFWPAVTDYLTRFEDQVVDSDDFRRVLEEHSGRTLAAFFEQWFRGAGHPKLQVRLERGSEGSRWIIEQQQESLFEVDVTLRWGARGRRTTETVSLEGRKTVVLAPMEGEPEELRVDPEGKLLADIDFNPGLALLSEQLRATDVVGRIEAGRMLLKHHGGRGCRAVGAALASEPFWGVRREWARGLGQTHLEAALDALVEHGPREEDPRVLPVLAAALGEHRSGRARDSLRALVDRGLGPFARGAAFHGLGKQRALAPLDVLKEAATAGDPGGMAASGALRGLGASRVSSALPSLVTALASGDPRIRVAAGEGLGELAAALTAGDRAAALDALFDGLRSDVPQARLGALRGLRRARPHERVEEADRAIAAYKTLSAFQDHVDADAMIASLHKAAPTSDGEATSDKLYALGSQLAELQARLRRLERSGEE